MKSFVPLFLLAGILAAGCGKTEKPDAKASEPAAAVAADPAAAAPASPNQAPVASPAPASTPRAKPKRTDPATPELTGYVHRFMTEQLHVFILQRGRLPENFAELVNTRLDSVPRAPPGYQWGIDRQTKEVKLVPQRQ